jgi:hypothetical protein
MSNHTHTYTHTTKGLTTINKTLHRKLNIVQEESHYNPGEISGAPERLAVPAPRVTPVALVLNDTNII